MIRKANIDTWCDYCKAAWGKNKDGSWHPKAQNKATVTCYSIIHPERQRSYCTTCLVEIQAWPGNTIFSLAEQIEYAKAHFAKSGFNVRIHEAQVIENV